MLTVTKYYADWCNPCKQLAPIFKKLEEQFKDRPVVFKNIDVDEDRTAAEKNAVRSLPTVIFEMDGEIVGRFVGLKSVRDYIDAVEVRLKAESLTQ